MKPNKKRSFFLINKSISFMNAPSRKDNTDALAPNPL